MDFNEILLEKQKNNLITEKNYRKLQITNTKPARL